MGGIFYNNVVSWGLLLGNRMKPSLLFSVGRKGHKTLVDYFETLDFFAVLFTWIIPNIKRNISSLPLLTPAFRAGDFLKIYWHKGSKNVIGRRIKEARLKSKPIITQADLSASLETFGLKIDRASISKIESGDRFVADCEVVGLAKALKASHFVAEN
jgi:hypothetical protein